MEYNVFVFYVDYNRNQQQSLVRKFYEEKQKMNLRKIQKLPIKKTYDENDYMSFDTLEDFNSRRQWKLIIDNVLKNPKFY